MIVSPQRGYVFVHIPKTGGTSMARALETRAAADDILIGDTPKAKRRKARVKDLPVRGRLRKHSRLSELDGWLSPAELERFFVFTLVRNPWDRMVSYYTWLRAQSFDHPAVVLAGQSTFEAFVTHPQTDVAARNDSAVAYVTCADGRVRCNAFVRLEHLDRDLEPVCRHLGFDLNLPHDNRSDRNTDYRVYYSDRAAAHVAGLYADDINRSGYRF